MAGITSAGVLAVGFRLVAVGALYGATHMGMYGCEVALRQTLGGVYTAQTAAVLLPALTSVCGVVLSFTPLEKWPGVVASGSGFLFAITSSLGLYAAAFCLAVLAGCAGTLYASDFPGMVLFAALCAGAQGKGVPAVFGIRSHSQYESFAAIAFLAVPALSFMFREEERGPERAASSTNEEQLEADRSNKEETKRVPGGRSNAGRKRRAPPRSVRKMKPENLTRMQRVRWLCRDSSGRVSPSIGFIAAVCIVLLTTAVVLEAMMPLGRVARARLLRPAMPADHVLVAQRESETGLVSVVEDRAREIRFLTCDHSVLGGRYISRAAYHENIFMQFHVHEAVRLTRLPSDPPGATGGRNGRALVLGLGIGVTAQSLHDHGCAVDAVELDSAVALYAARHFGLRGPTLHIADAHAFLARAAADIAAGRHPPYDYVLHDLFTGGAVPLPLFSPAAWRAVRAVLAPDGVLAVNYVGVSDAADPARRGAAAVSALGARLGAAFGHVRAFTDEHADAESRAHNFVFFASAEPARVTFRPPVSADGLGSGMREEALATFMRRETPVGGGGEWESADRAMAAAEAVTARQHWEVMREVFGHELWPAIAT